MRSRTSGFSNSKTWSTSTTSFAKKRKMRPISQPEAKRRPGPGSLRPGRPCVWLKKKSRKEQEAREQRVNELIERVAREAQEKARAEEALSELGEKLAALHEAQQEAQEKLTLVEGTRRQNQKGEEALQELAALRRQLNEKEQELSRIQADRLRIEQRHRDALNQASLTQDELIRESRGGKLPAELRALINTLLKLLGLKEPPDGNSSPSDSP